ncbi:MAG TPA: class I SAM-dependent methyltransferase [Streptosporangiaceae bacterium]
MKDEVAASWDAEYATGQISDELPVPFINDIMAAAFGRRLDHGLYVGCGNGRNFLPLSRAGLTLTGLDVSGTALGRLATRAPQYAGRLVHGDLGAVSGDDFDLLIGIQVFQHGDRATAHAAIRQAQRTLRPGGLFCLRVNAVATDVWPQHEVTEDHPDGGFTVRYLAGPKAGLRMHFFSAAELAELFGEQAWEPVLPLRIDQRWRTAPEPGQWSQWEAIWALQ